MERKAFHALLLSLAVIAGAMTITTDAYAQTNTERLANVEDNTNSIIAAITGLADAITSGFAEVLAAIGAIQTGINSIDSELGIVHDEVEAIHSEVDSLSNDISATQDGLEDIGDKVDAVNAAIAGAAAALSQEDPAIAEIQEGVTANSVAIRSLVDQLATISDTLEMISEEVGVVQETVEAESSTPALEVSGKLIRDTSDVEVTIGDFIAGVNKHPANGVYTADATFSCDGDVFVTAMRATISTPATTANLFGDATPDPPTAAQAATITVDGEIIYAADYDADNSGGTADFARFAKNIVRNPGQLLSAGTTIEIMGSTDQSTVDIALQDTPAVNANLQEVRDAAKSNSNVPGTTNDANVTKSDAVKVALYTLEVDWFTATTDVTCGISTATTTGTGDLDSTDNTLVFAMEFIDPESTNIISDLVTTTIDCNGEPAQITKVENAAGGDLLAHVRLALMGGVNDGIVNFDATGNSIVDGDSASSLPYEFSNSMTISGKSPDPVLLRITYDTVADNKCSIVN